MLGQNLVLLLFSLSGSALGQAVTVSKSVCLTNYETKSVNPVPRSTATNAKTFTASRLSVVIPKKTITPKAKTRTKSVDTTTTITTTLPQETDTFSTTSTIETTTTTTVFDTITETELFTTTTTVGGGTSTVTTLAGYTPVQGVPGNPPSRKKRAEGHARRVPALTPVSEPIAQALSLEKRGRQPICGIKNGKPYLPNRYPKNVLCKKDVKVVTTKVITVTARWTFTKVAPAPTSYVTKTSTHTTSTTVLAVRASTTITEFTTTTLEATFTSTRTVTSATTATETFVAAPTATIYPACDDPTNYLSRRNGRGIQWVTEASSNWNGVVSGVASDSRQCCQQCWAIESCGGFAMLDGICYSLTTNVCQPQNVFAYYVSGDDFNIEGYTVGNGRCGRVQWDGNRAGLGF